MDPASAYSPNSRDEGRAAWRLEVRPSPTDEELAALVVALLTLDSGSTGDGVPNRDTLPSRWAMAGRRAARSGIVGGAPIGWGRPMERR